jgi:cellulose synthase/poly-beta-1,6-N-acetylglucosamine synthase-like glycosyltransferase
MGKTAAQNSAVQRSSGDILIFSDATTTWSENTVTRMVRNFADPEVGCVAGQLVYGDACSSIGQGCQKYWNWETKIRESESQLGSLIGVSGCLYAVRRSAHRRLAGDMIDDLVIAMEIHLQGLRTVYEPEAVAVERPNRHRVQEFRMRVRVIEQTMLAFSRYRPLLLAGFGKFGFQLVSHKVLRYAAPVFLIAAYLSNASLVNTSDLYTITFGGMTLFYLAAFAGWALDCMGRRTGLLTIPYYFTLANLASIIAFIKFLRGDSRLTWEPMREPIEQKL